MAATNASKAAAAKNDVVSDSKEIVEDVVELVEDSVELVKRTWIKSANPKVVLGVTASATLILGASAGYLVASKLLAKKYQAQADAQVEDVKNHYGAIHKTESSLDEMARQYGDNERLEEIKTDAQRTDGRREGYVDYSKIRSTNEAEKTAEAIVEEAADAAAIAVEDVVQEVQTSNVFDGAVDTLYDEVAENAYEEANPGKPFVITRQEFDNSDSDFEQNQLTYYSEDNALADANDQIINEIDKIVGERNVSRFGAGSGDPNVVYVRNPTLEIEFEIVHSDGSYAKEVLGFESGESSKSLTHSHRRMRPRDD